MKEKIMLRRCKAVLAAVIAMSLLGGCVSATEEAENADAAVQEVTEAIPVTEIFAKDDFYGCVNLDRLDSMEIGFGKASDGSFDETQDIIDERVRSMIKEIGESDEAFSAGSCEQLIHDIYVNYNEFENTCDSSEATFSAVFSEIDEAQDISGFMMVCAGLYRDYGVEVMLSVETDMNRLDAKNYGVYVSGGAAVYNSFSFENMMKSTAAALSVKSFNESFLKALGVDAETTEERAEDMVNIAMDVARNTDIEVLKDSNPVKYITEVTADEMNGIFTGFDFSEFVKAMGAETLPEVYYTLDKNQLEAVNSVLTESDLTALKDYAKASFASQYGYFLPDSMKHMRDKYYAMPKTNREKLIIDEMSMQFPDIIGEAYAKRYTDEAVLEAVEEMCEELRSSCYDLIGNAEWLSEGTRELLQKKLGNLKFLIGAPVYDADNSDRVGLIGSDLLQTLININAEDAKRSLSHIGEEYSSDIVGMPPQTVNACYDTNNTITIPMGITLPPFFDIERSDAMNYGALGTVIAHEMSHAFDSNCIDFDADGNYDPHWLPEADRLAFEEKMRLTEEYYSKFTIMDVYHVDGENTLGENFADLGGVECVMSVFSGDDEKKEVLESYAALWCTLENDITALEALRYDVHSPAIVRVNAVVSSCDDFYRLYDVKEGDGMYIAPEDRVSRW
ncbi:MAG: M13 family metallopeptidase [Oscillospiraceae bacterium]